MTKINREAWVIVGPNDEPQLWTVASSKVGAWRSLVQPRRLKEYIAEYKSRGYRAVSVHIKEIIELNVCETCGLDEDLCTASGCKEYRPAKADKPGAEK